MSCHDILHDLILAPVDVGLHIFQPNFLNSFSKQGVLAVHVLRSIELIYLDPPRNPVVKKPQGLTDPGGSSFMSIIQTNVLPALSLYGTSRRYGRLPPPGPRSCKFTPLFPGLP